MKGEVMDEVYFLARMRAALAMAAKATNAAVKLIDLDLAGRYSVAAVGQNASADRVPVAPAETGA